MTIAVLEKALPARLETDPISGLRVLSDSARALPGCVGGDGSSQ